VTKNVRRFRRPDTRAVVEQKKSGIRVTRFGEFSPIWAIVYFGRLSKITAVVQLWAQLSFTVKVRYQFLQKMGWATTLWAIFFRKLIWSPCHGL
jgi:hypothetical protein